MKRIITFFAVVAMVFGVVGLLQVSVPKDVSAVTISETEQKVFPDHEYIDNFGESVSVDGNTAVVGSIFDWIRDPIKGWLHTGATYIYERNSEGAWTQVREIRPLDLPDDAQFGNSVAISGDTIVIGAHFDGRGEGAAYIFEKNAGVWPATETKRILASDIASTDNFGTSVGISGDTIIVSSFSRNAGISSGAAYIFEKNAGVWPATETKKILAPIGTNSDFGVSVSIDGNAVVVGASFGGFGAAYIFEKDAGVWPATETKKILASDGANSHEFGGAVSISGDTAIVGAIGVVIGNPLEDPNGLAYVFVKKQGVWSMTESEKVQASDADDDDRFGNSVSISGSNIVVGAHRKDVDVLGYMNSGAAYFFNTGGIVPPAPLPLPTSAAHFDTSGDDGDPVNTYTGELFNQYSPDINLGGPMPLYFSRYYASGLLNSSVTGSLGDNWRHNFEWSLTDSGTDIDIVNHRGRLIRFTQNGSAWDLTGKTDIVYQLVENAGVFTLLDPRSRLLYIFNASGQLTGIEDGKGNVHTLSYDGDGLLVSVSDGLGRTLSLSYDTNDLLISLGDGTRTAGFAYTGNDLIQVTDALSNITTYTYDTGGLMTSWTLPEGNTPYSQTYVSGQVVSQTDSDGNISSFNYSGSDTTMTDPLSNTRVHTHTVTGELAAARDQAGQDMIIGSDSTGRRNSITDRAGNTISFVYDPASGEIASITYADSTAVSYAYTSRVTGGITYYDETGISYPDSTTESFTYDTSGNKTSRTNRVGNTEYFTYTANGQPAGHTNYAGGIVSYSYNSDGTLAARTDAAGNTITFSYDSLKRRDLASYPDGSSRSFTRNNDNRILTETDQRGNTTTLTYDSNGNPAAFQDTSLNTTSFAYDGNDRLIGITDPFNKTISRSFNSLGSISSSTDENGNIIATLGYDAQDNLTSITDNAGNTWSSSYDVNGFVVSTTDPLANTAFYTRDELHRVTRVTSPSGYTSDMTYDVMGRTGSTTDALGNTTTFTYDANGRPSGVTLPGGAISASYTYNAMGKITAMTDPTGNIWNMAYDNSGRQISGTDPLGNQAVIAYDNRNRPDNITFPGSLGTETITYDPVGNVTGVSYSDGTVLGFTYDASSRMITANNGDATPDNITRAYDTKGNIIDSNGIGITRDPGGRIISMTLASGKIVSYAYDANNLVTQITDWVGGTSVFTYDAAGRLISISRPNGIDTTNTYDNDNRLTGITEGAVSSIILTRDGNARITGAARSVPLAISASGLTSQTRTYDAASQLTDNTYDAAGRLIAAGSDTYTWDMASRLTGYTAAGTTVAAAYDALGRRISRTAGGITSSYVLNDALGIFSVSVEARDGADFRYFIHTPDGALLYSIDAVSNARSFYHYDEMGNTIFVTDDAGAVIDSYAYSPYGKLTASTGALDNPFTWQGRFGVMDEGNDIYYMRARYYDSTTGRFVSRDPIKSISPRAVNPYQYALANPLRFVDPLGNYASDAEVQAAERLYFALVVAWVAVDASERANAESIAAQVAADAAKVAANAATGTPYFAFALAEFKAAKVAHKVATKAAIDAISAFQQALSGLEIARTLRWVRTDKVPQTKREANILHLKEIPDKAEEKASKALDALNTGSRTRLEHAARLKALKAAESERDEARALLRDAVGIESVIPELEFFVPLS